MANVEDYLTWCVDRWIESSNAEESYWREKALEVYEETAADPTFPKEDSVAITLGDMIHKEIKEGVPIEADGLYSDLISAALGQVNWFEIANSILWAALNEKDWKAKEREV